MATQWFLLNRFAFVQEGDELKSIIPNEQIIYVLLDDTANAIFLQPKVVVINIIHTFSHCSYNHLSVSSV